MRSPFVVEASELQRLLPHEAVSLMRLFLFAEADRVQIPRHALTISGDINVPDGGVDASVALGSIEVPTSALRPGANAFQIKAGAKFKPWRESDLRAEVYPNAQLASAIRSCLESGGRYVLVATGATLTDAKRQEAVTSLKAILAEAGFADAAVDVWSSDQLAAEVSRFPGLVRTLRETEGEPFEDHGSWAGRGEMLRTLVPSRMQEEAIEELRRLLRASESQHLILSGEAGVGKTRLVLEALREDDLRGRVVYVDRPMDFCRSRMGRLLAADPQLHAILVLDDCEESVLADYLSTIRGGGVRLRTISITQEPGHLASANTLRAKPLSTTEIANVIRQHYDVPNDQIEAWAELCGGSPRVAHVVGANLREHPDDVLRTPAATRVWHRYVEGTEETDKANAEVTLCVLKVLSLFKRVGYEPPFEDEGKCIAEIVQGLYPRIGEGDFRRVVDRLRQRRVLQGERTLYITPGLLHAWLWGEWWRENGAGFIVADFMKRLRGDLRQAFIRMWKWGRVSDTAAEVARRFLRGHGPPTEDLLREEEGSDFFLRLVSLEPEAGLEALERTLGQWSDADVAAFGPGRRNVVFALERIVEWAHLFTRGATLLLRLAEHENEPWANNATGVFAGLFGMGTGKVAPTAAAPDTRFDVLKRALRSDSVEVREIGVKACAQALESRWFSRTMGADAPFDALRPPGWTPRNGKEWFDGYRRVWDALAGEMQTWEEAHLRLAAADVILQSATGLLGMPSLAVACAESLAALVEGGWLPKARTLEIVEWSLESHAASMPETAREILGRLVESLGRSTLEGRILRAVHVQRWEEPEAKRDERVDAVAKELLANQQAAEGALASLIRDGAPRAPLLGYLLGRHDERGELLHTLVALQRRFGPGSLAVLGGYMRAVRERAPDAWEVELDGWAADAEAVLWIPEVTWRAGITDRAAVRIAEAIEAGYVDGTALTPFRYGGLEQVSSGVFERWLDLLLRDGPRNLPEIGVDLCHSYYVRGRGGSPMPIEPVGRLLERTTEVSWSSTGARESVYAWVQVADAYLRAHPDEAARIVSCVLRVVADGPQHLGPYEGYVRDLLAEAVKTRPADCWPAIGIYLEKGDIRTWRVLSFVAGGVFGEGEGIWGLLDVESVLRWVEEDVDVRAALLAEHAQRTVKRETGALTRALLERYGDREDVTLGLIARFSSGGWFGKASEHYREQSAQVRLWLADEQEPNVRRWLEALERHFRENEDRARVREEREDW